MNATTVSRLLSRLIVIAVALGTVACRSESGTGQVAGTPAPTSPGFPLSVSNCGQNVLFERPPERAVTMDQIATETLLHLGLSGAMVGTAFATDAIFPTVADAYKRVPVLAAKYPSKEVLIAASPDFVLGNMDFFTYSGFPPGANFTRRELTDRGIATYTLQCQGEQPDAELMFTRFKELGRIFGVGSRADAIVEGVRSSLAATAAALDRVPPVKVFVYRKGGGPMTTYGGGGTADYGLRLSGGRNIFDYKPSLPPPEVSTEAVIDRNPQVILISNEDAESPEDKKATARRLLTETTAVKANRFCTTDFFAFGTLFRLARDVNVVGACLHPDITFPTFPRRDNRAP